MSGRRKTIELNGTIFKTQGSFETFVKQLIYEQIGVCANVCRDRPEQYLLLLEVLRRHPSFDFKTLDMKCLKVVPDVLNQKALKVIIVKQDESELSISWRSAITGKSKDPKCLLISAMRSSIGDQIGRFKDTATMRCEICGITAGPKFEVDHIIHFEKLTEDFLQSTPLTIPSKFNAMTDGTHRCAFRSSDVQFELQWQQYHQLNATLRMLCEPCNRSRPKHTKKTI